MSGQAFGSSQPSDEGWDTHDRQPEHQQTVVQHDEAIAVVAAPATGLGLNVLISAAAVMAVASVLPWAKLELGGLVDTINGFEGDGRLTLGLAVVVAALGWGSRSGQRSLAIGALIASALAAVIAAIDIIDLESRFDGVASVSYGLWLLLVASIAAVAAAGKLLLESRARR